MADEQAGWGLKRGTWEERIEHSFDHDALFLKPIFGEAMRFKEKLGFQKRQVAVIGDSHANFLFGAYPDFDIFWVGPVTMHRVGRDGLSSLMLPRWGFPRFDPSPLKHYRFVFLSFGEIDCRAHISRIASSTCKTIEFVITELIEKYLL